MFAHIYSYDWSRLWKIPWDPRPMLDFPGFHCREDFQLGWPDFHPCHASPDTSWSMVGHDRQDHCCQPMTGPRSAKALSLFSGPAVAYRLPKRQTSPLKAWKANEASVIGDYCEQEKGPQNGGHECVRLTQLIRSGGSFWLLMQKALRTSWRAL